MGPRAQLIEPKLRHHWTRLAKEDYMLAHFLCSCPCLSVPVLICLRLCLSDQDTILINLVIRLPVVTMPKYEANTK